MDERTRKIRHGLILQGCVEESLKRTKYSDYEVTPRYSEESIAPDFLVPDDKKPTFFIEVAQTEARNSFQMKILRYFESVCEGKVHFGSDVISVNILMGDPASELPASNVRALYGFFDANLCPRNNCHDRKERLLLEKLESDALLLAGNELIVDVETALGTLLRKHSATINVLSKLVEQLLDNAQVKRELFPLWKAERRRRKSLKNLNAPLKDAPAYKRPILESLFLTDEEFEELRNSRDLSTVSLPLLRQLAGKGLLKLNRDFNKLLRNVFLISEADFTLAAGTPDASKLPPEVKLRLEGAQLLGVFKGIRVGERQIERAAYSNALNMLLFARNTLKLNDDLSALIGDPFAGELRKRCVHVLRRDPDMNWFFEDIRDENRRLKMATAFLKSINGRKLISDLEENLRRDVLYNIEHGRAWFIDLCTRAANISQNELSRRLFTKFDNPGGYGDPVSHLAPKTQRFRASPDAQIGVYARDISQAFWEFMKERNISITNVQVNDLALRLLLLRLDGASKLQNLNPLYLLIESVCEEGGLVCSYGSSENFLSDLVSDVEALGKFKLYRINAPTGVILVNALYVDEYGGLDKAKEWSARGRSFPYRFTKAGIRQSSVVKMIFIADGAWKSEAISRLRAAGWDVCRPSEFRERLRTL